MMIEEHDKWMTKSTRIIYQKSESNRGLLNDAIKKAGVRSAELKGNTTSFDVEIHERAVTNFQGNEIVALIDIMMNRQGLAELDLITPGDLKVNQSLANDLFVTRTQVTTEVNVALDNVRKELERFEYEKTKHQAGLKDRARIAIESERTPE